MNRNRNIKEKGENDDEEREQRRIKMTLAEGTIKSGKAEKRLNDKSTNNVEEGVLVILRERIDQLPEAERQVIALHCCGELSLDDIAAALDVKRNTVSMRIRSAQERLEDGMRGAAGGREAVPVTLEMIDQAICSGAQAPEGMLDRIMTRIERFELEAILKALYEEEVDGATE